MTKCTCGYWACAHTWDGVGWRLQEINREENTVQKQYLTTCPLFSELAADKGEKYKSVANLC